MPVKREVEGIEDWKERLRTRANRVEEPGKRRRIDTQMDVPEVGVTPTGMEEGKVSCRNDAEETKRTIKVEADADVLKDGGPARVLEEDDARADFTDEEVLEEQGRKYEEERNRILEENRKRMLELGLSDLSKHLSSNYRTQAHLKSAIGANGRINYMKHKVEAGFQLPLRRSARVERHANKAEVEKVPTYKDFSNRKQKPRENVPQRRKPKPTFTLGGPELYTEEHVKLLGSYEQGWELFRDGCYSGGGRIYDSVTGKTCHQCRQKTLGHRTWCDFCKALSGQFCGDCLFMRYGENVLEAKANTNWTCPVCRGICNCSFCRTKRGWAPTGNMYRHALAAGFPSVAHYLIMTRQCHPACKGVKTEQGGERCGVDQLDDIEVKAQVINDSNIQPGTPSPTQRTSRSASKVEACEVGDVTLAELARSSTGVVPMTSQVNNALPLEMQFRCLESESFIMMKVEENHTTNLEGFVDGSASIFCKKIKQEECQESKETASQLQDAQKKRKGLEGTCDGRSGDLAIGDVEGTDVKPEKRDIVNAPEGRSLSADTHPRVRRACLGLKDSPVAVRRSGRSNPACVVYKGSEACQEEALKVEATETSAKTPACVVYSGSEACQEEAPKVEAIKTSAKYDTSGKKLVGRTKAEIVHQRLTLKETSQLSPPKTPSCRTEVISNRLRRKEAISYKRFL